MRAIAVAARLVRLYALALAVAAGIIVLALVDDGLPDTRAEWVPVVVIGAVVAIPPVVLLVFAQALRALADLPTRVRDAPAGLREHREEAQRLLARRGLGGVVLLPFRLLRLSAGARETLTPYAPVVPLVSVPFLAAAGFAAVAGLAVLLLGLVALVDLAA
jgi:hypothetical protein